MLRVIERYLPVVVVSFILALFITYLVGAVILVLSPGQDIVVDTTAPEITLNGDKKINIYQDEVYEEPGAVVTDGELVISGKVDMAEPNNYLVLYTATDDVGNIAMDTRVVTVTARNTGVIYLTFDDGPSVYTAELLDVLKKYNVKATFFVTGYGSDDMLRREYNEGHAIALHSYTHDYAYIYSSVDNYFEDLYRIQERVKNATGYTSYLMRFPGGSSNLVSTRYDNGSHIMTTLSQEVERRGFTYFDWNISSGDAGNTTNTDTIYYNVINGVYRDGKSVVLQHDSKGYSVAAVEKIIQWGLANGFTFAKLDASSFTAHHRVNN